MDKLWLVAVYCGECGKHLWNRCEWGACEGGERRYTQCEACELRADAMPEACPRGWDAV